MDLFELLQMMTGAPQISDMLQYLIGEKVEVQNTQEARKRLREQVRQQWRLSRSAQELGATTYTGQRENAETAE